MKKIIFHIFVFFICSTSLLAQQKGDKVQVYWGGSWYNAVILRANNNKWLIHYDGYSDSWDEWVGLDRMRWRNGEAIMVGETVSKSQFQNGLAFYVVELESNILWSAVDASWRAKRSAWIAAAKVADQPQSIAKLLLELEASVTWEAVEASWKTSRDNWVQNLQTANTYNAVSTLLIAFEAQIKWAAVSEQWKTRRNGWVAETQASGSIDNTPKTVPVLTPPASTTVLSDVDTPPQTSNSKPYTFALIIGNEDYKSFQEGLNEEKNVAFAENDAKIFREYLIKTIGVPAENITYLVNARAVEMNKAINKLSALAKTLNGKAELILFYAGHGLPDEKTKVPYLIPVDVSSSDLSFAVKLDDVYKKLTENPVQRSTVFLDACFSGGARGQGLVDARGFKIAPAPTTITVGNLVVFSSSSGEQSSLPYKEKQHGMFTYFLLKKLQETKGDVSYEQLSEYLKEQVAVKSILVNSKEQTPNTLVSPAVGNTWKTWILNK
jgi:hypothetical protein